MRTFPEMVKCGATDFGRHILPALPRSAYRAFAYDFARNKVPGVRDYEALAYWRAAMLPDRAPASTFATPPGRSAAISFGRSTGAPRLTLPRWKGPYSYRVVKPIKESYGD